MHRIVSGALVLCLGWSASSVLGGEQASSEADVIVLKRCSVEFERTTQLGASIQGVLQDCLVKPGDAVRAKQTLGRLQDQVIRADLESKMLEAGSDIEVRLKKATYEQALAKAKVSSELNSRRFISNEEIRLHRLEVETAALNLEEAQFRRKMAAIRAREVEATLRSREFVAPHDGIVVAVFRSEGESVIPGPPVFCVVKTDRAHVTGFLDVTRSWHVRKDQPVRIILDIPGAELPAERETFQGIIIFVDNQITPDQTCKVVAEIPNRGNILRAGLKATMEILPFPETASESPAVGGTADTPARGKGPATRKD
jgi:multidrug efflux pump subunit AcrA (membrane-fusion protein)